MASLRTPRVAIAVPNEGWQLHARRAIEFLSTMWGGASGVVVPLTDGVAHPAVLRLLRRYDADYVTTLQLRLCDQEELKPGSVRFNDSNGKEIPASKRAEFIARAAARGPCFIGLAVDSDLVDALSASLPAFRDGDGTRRVYSVHPSQDPPTQLARVVQEDEQRVVLETGDPLIDLAVATRIGLPDHVVGSRSVAKKTLTRRDVAAVVCGSADAFANHPFAATRQGLATISSGWARRAGPVVVLGGDAQDLALAMLIDRTVGRAAWLPVTHRHTTWLGSVGVALDSARSHFSDTLRVTSTSLSASQCMSLITKIWAARYAYDPTDNKTPWAYVDPFDFDVEGRNDLRVADKWDERFAVPVSRTASGGAEMITTYPLLAAELSPERRGWIVETRWPERPVLAHASMTESDLYAGDQDPHETFVRPSAVGIAFESGRWDFVAAGASKYGQLAQPKLRWPSLLDTLARVAESRGHAVQSSHAGRVARIAADLWGGRDELTADLSGPTRRLVEALLTANGPNAPIDKEPGLPNEARRLRIQGSAVAPFCALTRIAAGTPTEVEVRDWLDRRTKTGAIRAGFVLACGVCPWLDFYRTESISSTFVCRRCGSVNEMSLERWRDPLVGPTWYYDLHPTITEYLDQNGDLPTLAVEHFGRTVRGVRIPDFEIELIDLTSGRPVVEIDFALMTGTNRLVLGEAKKKGKLDGASRTEHIRDVRKLLDAAELLGAHEICFATGARWSQESREAIADAVQQSASRVTVSVIESLRDGTPKPRAVLHHPAGP